MSMKNAIKIQENNIIEKVTTDSEKYKIALKFINILLNNLNMTQINSLTEFKDVDREDIIKEVNKKSFDDMASEIFNHYNKKKCGYYRKTDALVLNCLRGMMKEIGLELVKIQKEKSEEINGKVYRRAHMIYSIKKIVEN